MSNQELLKLELYDYTLNPLEIGESIVIVTDPLTEFSVTEEETSHPLGRGPSSSFPQNWVIQGNTLLVKGVERTSQTQAVSIFNFSFKQVATKDGRILKKFKNYPQ